MVAAETDFVREENLRAGPGPVDNYRRVENEVEAMAAFLLYDIKRLLNRVPEMTPARLADIAGLSSDWTIRDIRKPDWYVKNIATLFRLERALCSHPAWQPKAVFGTKALQTTQGFVYRRWVDPVASVEFGADTVVWESRRSDAAFLDRMVRDPWASVVDVSGGDPKEYVTQRYAPAMTEVYGIDKTGTKFINNPNADYGAFVARDFQNCVTNNAPRSRDMFHSFRRLSDRIVFRNASWPCLDEGLIVSKIKIEYWRPNVDRVALMPPRPELDTPPILRRDSSS